MDGARRSRLVVNGALTALPFAALILLWWLLRETGLINPGLLPSPFAVFGHFWTGLTEGELGINILMSLQRVLAGLLLGTAAAVPVGFLIGWYRPVRRLIDPLINFFRALPPIALIPLVIVYLGIGEIAKIAILFYASFFAGGDRDVRGHRGDQPDLRARRAHARRHATSRSSASVIVPLTVPHILVALRVALGVAGRRWWRPSWSRRSRAWAR